MKTTRFLITIISVGALTLRAGFAGQSHPALEGRSSETRPKTTLVGPYRLASGNKGGTTGAKTTTKAHPGPKLPQTVHRNATRGGDGFIPASRTSGSAAHLQQPGNTALTRQPGARLGPPVNETQHQRPPNLNPNLAASAANEMPSEPRLPVAGLSGTPSPNLVVPHRGPVPTVLGGSPFSSARNAAVINGTGMRHKL